MTIKRLEAIRCVVSLTLLRDRPPFKRVIFETWNTMTVLLTAAACYVTSNGRDYQGTLSTTVSNHICQRWTSYKHVNTPISYFPGNPRRFLLAFNGLHQSIVLLLIAAWHMEHRQIYDNFSTSHWMIFERYLASYFLIVMIGLSR